MFLALESPEFCNNYLRSTPQPTGLVTIQGKYTVSTLRHYLYLCWSLDPTSFHVLPVVIQVKFSFVGFMFFWAWVFIVTTTLTAIFKSERQEDDNEQPEGVLDTYKTLWKIIRLPAVFKYCVMLLTAKVLSLSTHFYTCVNINVWVINLHCVCKLLYVWQRCRLC